MVQAVAEATINMKVKVLKIATGVYSCYECGNSEETIRGVTNWSDMTLEEYSKLSQAISLANRSPKNKWQYFLVEQVEDVGDIYQSAQEFTAYQQRREKERQQIEQKRKVTLAKKAKERKRKQFEKLKKEFGD